MNWWTRLKRRRTLERDLAENLPTIGTGVPAIPMHPRLETKPAIRESMREPWSFTWLETTLKDTQYALRGMRRNPGFAITAIGSLAVGIAAVIAIYSAADALLFRPMPMPSLTASSWSGKRTARARPHNVISPGNFLDWKARNRVFQDMVAFRESPTNLSYGDRSEQLRIQYASANFFAMLGVSPLRGRVFSEAEALAKRAQRFPDSDQLPAMAKLVCGRPVCDRTQRYGKRPAAHHHRVMPRTSTSGIARWIFGRHSGLIPRCLTARLPAVT